MNPIEEQKEIITKLYHLVRQSVPFECIEVSCRFEYSVEDDGSKSVGGELWYYLGCERLSAVLEYDREISPIKLVPLLHSIMRAHTGGDWKAFTLTINSNGSVTTKFEYVSQVG